MTVVFFDIKNCITMAYNHSKALCTKEGAHLLILNSERKFKEVIDMLHSIPSCKLSLVVFIESYGYCLLS